MPAFEITEHLAETGTHKSFYLECGPADGPLIIFVHGWPELSLSWRDQLPHFAALGFRCVAPDMRGYGRSTVYREHNDYAQELIVGDMIGLLDFLGNDSAIWVGHDWGSPVVWNIASHHPDRCDGIASLCVPYFPGGFAIDALIELVDRSVYPEETFPAGQWEYMRFYEENFAKAEAGFEANVTNTVKAMFRKGSPDGFGQPSGTAFARITGSFFGGADEAPDVPRDDDVISEEELAVYVEALERNSFFGPDSWYMNHKANGEYGSRALNDGYLDMPCLFIGAMYDYTCETITSRGKEPMEEHCRNLTLQVIKSGHWMAQEKPLEVNALLASWLGAALPDIWPGA